MSLLEEQLEEIRKKTAAVGVTPEMANAAPVSGGLLGIEPPKHWTEEVIERDGKGKFFGKMLLGGFTGMTPLLFPEMIGSRDRYKAELEAYNEQQAMTRGMQMAEPYEAMLANQDPSDDYEAIRRLAMVQPDIYGPVLRDMQKNKYAPNPDTYTEGEYQFDPAKGEWYLEQQSSAGGIQKTYMGPEFIPRSRMPGAEYIDKSIATADAEAYRANGAIQEIDSILGGLDEIERRGGMQSGVAGDVVEVVKDVFGTEDYTTQIRKQYEDIKVRSAIQNLPPGVASDKDIELVLAPWPDATSNPDLIRAKLEAIQRVEQAGLSTLGLSPTGLQIKVAVEACKTLGWKLSAERRPAMLIKRQGSQGIR